MLEFRISTILSYNCLSSQILLQFLDLAFSFAPAYRPKYGDFKGELIQGGWHNITARALDNNMDLMMKGQTQYTQYSFFDKTRVK